MLLYALADQTNVHYACLHGATNTNEIAPCICSVQGVLSATCMRSTGYTCFLFAPHRLLKQRRIS